ncbi:MAG: MarR family winged helix-turn-helix transcriptional regulator [Blastococcus sp.]
MSSSVASAPAGRPDDEVPVGQVADLLLSLSRARRWLSRLATDEPASLGASGISALAQVVRNGPMRMSDLAARERITAPTLSRVIAGLVEHGYVERGADPQDARAAVLTATTAGEELVQGLHSRRTEELATRLGRLSDDDRAALLAAAPALRRLLVEQ